MFAVAVERVHDDGRGGQVEALSQGRRGDGDLEDIVAQQALDLLAVGGRQGAVVQRDTEAKAFEDGAVRPEPFLAKRDRGVEDRGIGFEQRAQRAALMKIDDHVGERLDASPLRAEDQDGLPILDEPPRRREAEFALIVREEPRSTTLWRHPVRRRRSGEETLHPRALVADAKVQSRGGRCPDHLAEPQPGRPPVILDQAAGVITPQPCGEVVELIAVGQDRRQAHDPPFVRVRATKESLDLYLVADLALVEADHVPFVEDEEADIIEEGRIVAEREVELLRRRDDDVAFPDRVLVEAAHPDAAVERRDRLAERTKGPLQGGFRLRRQRTQRRDEDDALAAGQAAQDAQLGDARLAGAGRQRDHQIVGLIDRAGRRFDLRWPQVDLGFRAPLQQCDEQLAKPRPVGRFAAGGLERHPLVEGARPEVRQEVDRDAMRPPLRQHVQLAADGEARPKPLQRLIEERPLAAFQRKEEQGHGRHEGVGQRRVEAVEEEVIAAVGGIGRALRLDRGWPGWRRRFGHRCLRRKPGSRARWREERRSSAASTGRAPARWARNSRRLRRSRAGSRRAPRDARDDSSPRP